MKKTAVFLLFFLLLVCGPLWAQTYHEVKIYVPPLDGVGFIDDMAYFYKRVTGEIVMQYRTLGKARVLSDYVITGKVMPIAEEEIELPPDSEGDEYVLYVELFDNAQDVAIGEQFITFTIPDENTERALSVILYNLLSAIPDVLEGDMDNWRNRFLYLNMCFLWSPRVYNGEWQALNVSQVGAEFITDIHLLNFLSVRVGAVLTQDWVVILQGKGVQTLDMVIEFPVSVAYVLKPYHDIMLETYLGGSFNLSLGGRTKPYPFSWHAGVELDIKLGPGILTVDPRFTQDLGMSKIVSTGDEYWRSAIHLGIGYKLGFFNRFF